MNNFEKYRDKIMGAVAAYKKDIFDQLDCQLYHIRAGKAPCKKGLLWHGCRACNVDTLEWLTEEADKTVEKNCEKYADLIEEAVTSATYAGLRPECGMYMFRKHRTYRFDGLLYNVINSIDCDGECEKCRAASVNWLTQDAKE